MDWKALLKTYIVDVAFLGILFMLGVLAKNYVQSFFTKVQDYQDVLLSLDAELTNASTTALLEAEALVSDFNVAVYLAFFVVVLLVPFLLYLFLSISQSVNVGIVRKKLLKKNAFKSFLLGLPFLLVFYLFEGFFVSSIFGALETSLGLIFFFITLLLLILFSYVWYTLTILMTRKPYSFKKGLRLVYKKSYVLFPLFFVFALLLFIVTALVAFTMVRYSTDAIAYTTFPTLVVTLLVLLSLVQVLRMIYVKLVLKVY